MKKKIRKMIQRINKYILFTAAEKVECYEEEFSYSENTDDKVLIRNQLSLISPGTELAFFEGTHSSIISGKDKYPTCAGYSSVGIVEEVGKNITHVKPGDRVMATCGHCKYGWVDLYDKIPEGLGSEKAIFAVLGNVALHGVRELNPKIGENILISGLGTIGQLALRLCRITGVNLLVGADVHPFRMRLAESGGADCCLNVSDSDFADQANQMTDGRGFDAVIETSGNPKAITTALEYTANRGKLLILGCPHSNCDIKFYDQMQRREISIIGSYQPNCPENPTPYFPWSQGENRKLIMEYQLKNKFDFAPLITHRGKPEECQSLFDTLLKEKNNIITAVFEWDD